MVGSSGRATDGSKDAVGMMALHESLRTVCLDSDWTYSVFWTIRPRPRVRGGNGCKVGDDNGSLMLMWEDGFFRGRVADCLEEIDREDPVRRAFSKMSIQLYNYGEGLMGKVASDKCHKWVFKEPTESEPNISNYWQSSFDYIPSEWTDQFDSGIQTIAVIQAGHGLLQLGSCKIIHEDLHFVLRMRHTFESLAYQSGPFISKLFSSNQIPARATPDFFDWPAQQPLHPATSTPHFPASRAIELPHLIDERLVSVEEMMREERREGDIKWPGNLSMFQETDHSLGQLGSKYNQNDLQLMLESDNSVPMNRSVGGNLNEIFQLDKSRRSYTLPSKMALTLPSSSRAPKSCDRIV